MALQVEAAIAFLLTGRPIMQTSHRFPPTARSPILPLTALDSPPLQAPTMVGVDVTRSAKDRRNNQTASTLLCTTAPPPPPRFEPNLIARRVGEAVAATAAAAAAAAAPRRASRAPTHW